MYFSQLPCISIVVRSCAYCLKVNKVSFSREVASQYTFVIYIHHLCLKLSHSTNYHDKSEVELQQVFLLSLCQHLV